MTNSPSQRVSPVRAPDDYALPPRPEGAAGAAADSFRQTGFLLGGDLEVFADAMNLQLRVLRDAYAPKYRNHAFAALAGLWSRVYAYLADVCLLATRASYASTLPLVRTACECIAAQEGLRTGDLPEFDGWLVATLRPDERHKAFEFELGRYFSGTVLHDDDVLRGVYRPASDLGRPAFGATLVQVGPESNNQRLAISFAEQSFHLGWAEIVLGWLLALAARQVRVLVDAEGIVPISDETRSTYADLQVRVDAALARDDRCRFECIVDGNDFRYLAHNFRRASSAAPKKIVL